MSSENGGLYIMRDDEDEQWVRPTPAGAAIVDAVISQTDLSESDLANIHSYVDREDLRRVLEDDGTATLTFMIEDHEVSVETSGEISVSD